MNDIPASWDLWQRLQLARSILVRAPSVDTSASVLDALDGYTLEEIMEREYGEEVAQ